MNRRHLLFPLALCAPSVAAVAAAQSTTYRLNPPTSLYVTGSGSVRLPFKFYEVAGSDVTKLKRDPVINEFYDAISAFIRESGYNAPCSGRDLMLLKGTPAQLKAMQKQWITALANAPIFYTLENSSIGDTARDFDDAPITLDTYLMKGRDAQNLAYSYTFVTYPTKNKTWLLTCFSGNI